MPKYLLQKQPDGEIRVVDKAESAPPDMTDGPGDYWLTKLGTDETIVITQREPQRPFNVRLPDIEGEAEVSATLTGYTGGWLDAQSISVTWLRDNLIPVGTDIDYQIKLVDFDRWLTMKVLATNATGETTATALIGKIAGFKEMSFEIDVTVRSPVDAAGVFRLTDDDFGENGAAPAMVVPPAVGGHFSAGGNVEVRSGLYLQLADNPGMSVRYQWYRGLAAIDGAVEYWHTVTAEDVAQGLSVEESIIFDEEGSELSYLVPVIPEEMVELEAFDYDWSGSLTVHKPIEWAGTFEITSDGPAEPVEALVPPVITGTATIGSTVAVQRGLYAYDGDHGEPDVSWQWSRAGEDIVGATASTRVVTADDITIGLSVTETASNSGGTVQTALTVIGSQ